MPTLSTKRTGCFADVNCLLAYLEHHKPRNYRQKIDLLRQSLPAALDMDGVHRPQVGSWSLYDPRRVKCEALMGGKGKKRKQPTAELVASSDVPLASQHKRFKVEIVDLDRHRNITHFTDCWSSFVKQAGYSLNHPMPTCYDRASSSWKLYPELEADPKSIKAQSCEVRITIQPQ